MVKRRCLLSHLVLIDDQIHFVENKQLCDHIKFLTLMVSDEVELDEEIERAPIKEVVGFPEEEEVFTSEMIARRSIIPNTMTSLNCYCCSYIRLYGS